MCQAYEGERRAVVKGELAEIQAQWLEHESGRKPLSRQEIIELVARKMMLEER